MCEFLLFCLAFLLSGPMMPQIFHAHSILDSYNHIIQTTPRCHYERVGSGYAIEGLASLFSRERSLLQSIDHEVTALGYCNRLSQEQQRHLVQSIDFIEISAGILVLDEYGIM
jgi:hypothetical protein